MKKLVCPNCPDQARFEVGTLEHHTIIVDNKDQFIEDLGPDNVQRTSEPTCEKCGEGAKLVDDDVRPTGQLKVLAMIAEWKCNDYTPGAIVTALLKEFKLADLTPLLLFAVQNSTDLPMPKEVEPEL